MLKLSLLKRWTFEHLLSTRHFWNRLLPITIYRLIHEKQALE